jgi:hypothetical protein
MTVEELDMRLPPAKCKLPSADLGLRRPFSVGGRLARQQADRMLCTAPEYLVAEVCRGMDDEKSQREPSIVLLIVATECIVAPLECRPSLRLTSRKILT